MVLSIIICTYNRVKFLEKCLNSILKQISNNNIEIIVIDNNRGNVRNIMIYDTSILLTKFASSSAKYLSQLLLFVPEPSA